jgi:hypothetical protein
MTSFVDLLSVVPIFSIDINLFTVVYISNTRRKEWPGLTGLGELRRFATEYVKSNNIRPRNPKEWSEAFPAGTVLTFDNNFELGSMEFFRRPDVGNWTKAVLRSGGVFKYRWGDAPLRFLTMALFATDEEVLHRRDLHIEYCHPRCSPSCPCDKDGKPEEKVEIRERVPGYENDGVKKERPAGAGGGGHRPPGAGHQIHAGKRAPQPPAKEG